jgi:dihydrodipicolinate synthase/N-acetylneuraminate lyase
VPFTDDGRGLSEVRLARLVKHQIESGIDGFVLGTDVGEFTLMSFSERKQILEWMLREAQGRPLIANASTLSTAASMDLAQHASRHGARAVLLMPPYYGAFTAQEHIEHIRMIAKLGGLQVILLDPYGRLSETVRQATSSIPGVTWATSLEPTLGASAIQHDVPTTYEFGVGGVMCTPLALPLGHADRWTGREISRIWTMILRDLGSVRMMKHAMSMLVNDLGPVRSPYLPLTSPQHEVVKAIVAMTRQDLRQFAA